MFKEKMLMRDIPHRPRDPQAAFREEKQSSGRIGNDPLPNYGFGQHALFAAVQRSNRSTIDVLPRARADIRRRTEWWAGGFGVLDDCDPSLVDFLIERGAVIDAHSASRLAMMPKLRELVTADAALIHARGGDGQTPLHFVSTVEVAKFLRENSADIDARDVDHESTPAPYMLRVRQQKSVGFGSAR